MNGVTDVIVDNTHIEPLGQIKFVFCCGESTRLLVLIFSTAGRETVDESVPGRWQQKHQANLGHRFFDVHSPLNVNLKKHWFAARNSVSYRLPRRSIAMLAVNHGPLEKLGLLDHSVEVSFGHEKVVFPIDLPGARRTRGDRNRDERVGTVRTYPAGNRSLTHARRSGQHNGHEFSRWIRRAGTLSEEPGECVTLASTQEAEAFAVRYGQGFKRAGNFSHP
jgi:hypothetical protein